MGHGERERLPILRSVQSGDTVTAAMICRLFNLDVPFYLLSTRVRVFPIFLRRLNGALVGSPRAVLAQILAGGGELARAQAAGVPAVRARSPVPCNAGSDRATRGYASLRPAGLFSFVFVFW